MDIQIFEGHAQKVRPVQPAECIQGGSPWAAIANPVQVRFYVHSAWTFAFTRRAGSGGPALTGAALLFRIHFDALADRIARIHDQPLPGLEAAQNFDLVAV